MFKFYFQNCRVRIKKLTAKELKKAVNLRKIIPETDIPEKASQKKTIKSKKKPKPKCILKFEYSKSGVVPENSNSSEVDLLDPLEACNSGLATESETENFVEDDEEPNASQDSHGEVVENEADFEQGDQIEYVDGADFEQAYEIEYLEEEKYSYESHEGIIHDGIEEVSLKFQF